MHGKWLETRKNRLKMARNCLYHENFGYFCIEVLIFTFYYIGNGKLKTEEAWNMDGVNSLAT